MEVLIPGVLALVGALAGVLLSNFLSRQSKAQDDRRARLEEALRCVVLAISAKHFATRAGYTGKPEWVDESHIREFERLNYLANIERIFITLREARQAVAILVADGVNVGDSWRGDEEMQAEMENVYDRLVSALERTKRSRRG